LGLAVELGLLMVSDAPGRTRVVISCRIENCTTIMNTRTIMKINVNVKKTQNMCCAKYKYVNIKK